ncbi:MAG: hypothetical protein U0T31_00615 [Chitinophagales bacterium]
MKTKIILGIGFLALLISMGIYFLIPIFKTQIHGSEITVFIDKTDVQKEQLKVNDIVSLLDIDKHIWQRNKVELQTLSNFQYNNVQEKELPFAFFLVSNPKKRKKDIQQFKTELDSALQSIYDIDSGRTRSSIYEPIVRTLNAVSQSKAHKKILIVQSDLQENTQIFSVYRESDYLLLQRNREQIIERFTKVLALQNIQDIEVYLIYQPKSDADNDRFILMANLFKEILEQKGAIVHIGSNIVI